MPPLLPTGSSLRGRYRIHRVLHQSRLRNLYLAEDLHLKGKYWVVKEMQPVGVDASERTRLLGLFQAEALRMSALEHPNLPKLVDFCAQDLNLYVVREFFPGADLETILAAGRPLPEQDAARIGVQLCELMSYLSGRKLPAVIYRDMKLSNVLLCPDGQVKLLDVGFGSLLGGGQESMGSTDYAAPEQFADESSSPDARTLVYNVGALLYHVLTGRNPGTSPFALPRLEEIRPGLSYSIRAAVEKATRNQPRERHGTLTEFRKSLEKALGQPPKRDRSVAETATRSGGSVWPWILAILLVGAMGGALMAIYETFLR